MIKEYFKKSMNKNPIVSILILVYNAPLLTFITLLTLRRTTDVSYEVVVLDNNSKITTRFLLKILYHFGLIDKLLQSSENTYFAKGNNIASRYAHKKKQILSPLKFRHKNYRSTLAKKVARPSYEIQ